jgi:hypothetical protein
MRVRIVPRHVECPARMLVHERLQQFGDLAAPFVPAQEHDRLAGMIVHGADAEVSRRLSRRKDHDLLPFRAPQRAQGRQPTHVELIGVVEDVTGLQLVACLFDRLFFTAYSGSGLVMVCWGRLSTMSAALR